MDNNNILDNLQKRNNFLKSKLLHEQLRHDNFSFHNFKKYSLLILNEYKKHNSIYKAASSVGIDYNLVIRWYIQGQCENPQFRGFYLAINKISNDFPNEMKDKKDEGAKIEKSREISIDPNPDELEGEYIISQYGDGWSYKTFVDGEKIFIISNELETLKMKVKSKNLPLD